MKPVALAIMCKTPIAGASKTRLSPPLSMEECAALSACFIHDVSAKAQLLAEGGDVAGYAVYAPAGSEGSLHKLLPAGFPLLAQGEGDLGARMARATADLLAAGHAGVIVIGADSPTYPLAILHAAIAEVRADNIVLSPAQDGGYTLIGMSRLHARLFEDLPWSSAEVFRLTVARIAEMGLSLTELPAWYDVDDAESLAILEGELCGSAPPFAAPGLVGSDAPATFAFLRKRKSFSQT